jgi:thiamine-monophosphate kinase
MEKLGEIGEHEAVRRLTSQLAGHPLLRTGTGDDCAVATIPGTGTDQVFTTDPVIENIHFQAGEKPERIGNKAAGRVLSDIAAMGALPQWLLVNVVASAEQDLHGLEKIYVGMNALCERYGATLIGGDLARGPCLELHVFGTGTLPAGTALLRSGARPGDALFVTGPLGCSIEGRHLDFMPRVEEGIFLRETGLVNAMMDISDGLATDLRHILKQSGVGALLESEMIPTAGTQEQALYDGEDFELLFTAAPGNTEALRSRWRERFGTDLSMVGTVTAKEGLLQLRRDGTIEIVAAKAFEHFSKTAQRRVQ